MSLSYLIDVDCISSKVRSSIVFLENKKKDGASPLWISDELEFWPESTKFVQIASLHSELIGLSSSGQLHQWRWIDPEPFKHPDVS